MHIAHNTAAAAFSSQWSDHKVEREKIGTSSWRRAKFSAALCNWLKLISRESKAFKSKRNGRRSKEHTSRVCNFYSISDGSRTNYNALSRKQKRERVAAGTGVKLQLAPQALIQNQRFAAAILKIFNAWAALIENERVINECFPQVRRLLW